MIPLASVVDGENRGVDLDGIPAANGQCHGDPGGVFLGFIDQNGAAVECCGGTDQDHAKSNTKSTIFQTRVPDIAGKHGTSNLLGNAGSGVLNGQIKLLLPFCQGSFNGAAFGGEF